MKIIKIVDIWGHIFYINAQYIVAFAENSENNSIEISLINGLTYKMDLDYMSLKDFISKVGDWFEKGTIFYE